MVTIQKIIKRKELLFFTSYIIFMVFSIMSSSLFYSFFVGMYKYVVIFCMLLLIIQELTKTTHTKKLLLSVALMSALAVFVIIRSEGEIQTSFACIFLYAFCAREISFNKIARITAWLTCIVVLIVIIGSLVNVIPDYVLTEYGRTRHFLGFRYTLYPSAFLLNVILLETYRLKSKIGMCSLVIFEGVSYVLYLFTDARLSFYLSTVVVILSFVCKLRGDSFEKLKYIPKLLIPIFVVCCVISIGFIKYSPAIVWQRNLNIILSGRLSLGKASLIQNGFPLFGKKVEWYGNALGASGERSTEAYSYVDNMYIQILQRYGIVFLVVFLAIITACMVYCYKQQLFFLEIVLAILALHGIIDNLILYLHFNTFWLTLGFVLFSETRINRIGIKRKTKYEGFRENSLYRHLLR